MPSGACHDYIAQKKEGKANRRCSLRRACQAACIGDAHPVHPQRSHRQGTCQAFPLVLVSRAWPGLATHRRALEPGPLPTCSSAYYKRRPRPCCNPPGDLRGTYSEADTASNTPRPSGFEVPTGLLVSGRYLPSGGYMNHEIPGATLVACAERGLAQTGLVITRLPAQPGHRYHISAVHKHIPSPRVPLGSSLISLTGPNQWSSDSWPLASSFPPAS